MNKIPLILLLLVAILASCNSDSFKIDGNIAHLDGNTLKVVFIGDSGVVEEIAEVDRSEEHTSEQSRTFLLQGNLTATCHRECEQLSR